MDHAAFGVQILFEEGRIRDYVAETDWDSIICTAIARHSDFKLEGVTDERELLHARLIRDADKLDNCRVKLEDSIETILGVSAEEVGSSAITPEVMAQFMNHQSIYSPTRETQRWTTGSPILPIIMISTMKKLWKSYRNTIMWERQIARIPYDNPTTAAQMQEIKKILQDYFCARINTRKKIMKTIQQLKRLPMGKRGNFPLSHVQSFGFSEIFFSKIFSASPQIRLFQIQILLIRILKDLFFHWGTGANDRLHEIYKNRNPQNISSLCGLE